MSRLLLILTLSASASAWARNDSAVAVLDIQGTGVSQELLPTLTEVLTVEIAELGLYKVIAGRDIQSMLGFERQKDVLGCTDAACLAEIGGALGVDRIVASHIGMVGSTYVVNIKLINIRMANTEARVYETVRGEVDDLINTIKKSVRKLLGVGSKAAIGRGAGDVATAGPKAQAASSGEALSAGGTSVPRQRNESAAVSSPASATAPAPMTPAEPAPAVRERVESGRRIGVAPWIFWGGGAAALVGGAIFGLQARNQEKRAQDSQAAGGQVAAKRAPELAHSANILFGLGGVAVAGGFAWWLLLGGSSSSVALAPILTDTGTGLAMATTF
jgi:hypothetical protein